MPTATGANPTLDDVTRYLSLTGWTGERLDELTVFYPADDSDLRVGDSRTSDLQIVLPIESSRAAGADIQIAVGNDPDPRDLARRIDAAIEVIAYTEGRTSREVRANLTGTGADTIAIRMLTETPSGTAPLAAAQAAITALRDLVVGSASALRNPALVLPGRPSVEIDDYANRTHFSTRPGSFIVDLTLPLTQESATGDREGDLVIADPLPDDEALIAVDDVDATPRRDFNPYGRAVSRRIRQTITRALNAADQVATGDHNLTIFTEAGRGLGNATELEAIANLGGGLGAPYQVRFAESALAPGAEPVEVLTATPSQQQILAEAASLIRERQTFPDISLTGYIIRLFKRSPNPHAPGDVTIRTVVDELGATINCWVHLVGSDYEHALNAHQEGHEVYVTGNLDYNNGRWRLSDVSEFRSPTN